MPNGGARAAFGADNHVEGKPIENPDNIFMDGSDIFSFTLKAVPELMAEVMEKNSDCLVNIDLFVLHQANRYMLDFLRQKMKIDEQKMYINMEKIGNTVSSTVPIALKDAGDEQVIKQGDKVAIAGFGVGLSWAGCELFF